MKDNNPDSTADLSHLELDRLNYHTELPKTKVSECIDTALTRVGDFISWVWIILMAVIVINVFMRYVLGEGRIEFEELQWHLYSAGWLLGLSYCFVADDHVRVDLFHHNFKLRTQAWIELFGIVLLLIPFLAIVLWYSLPFIAYSWQMNEVSGDPGGLPFRWLIKSVLFLGFALLSLATLSRLSRVIALLLSPKTQPASVAAAA